MHLHRPHLPSSRHPRPVARAQDCCAAKTLGAVTRERPVALVDDDESVRASTAFLLERVGIRVQTFPSGGAFLDADADSFSCVLLDLRMPGLDGLAVLQLLADRGPAPPVLVITGHGSIAAGVQALKLGAYDFLEKPYAPEDLLSALQVGFQRGQHVRDGLNIQGRAAGLLATLSQRQFQVALGVVRGQHNKIIAFELGLSVRTVEADRAAAMQKLGVRTTPDLVRLVGQADLPGT